MSECDILLVRHPETEANVDGRYVGRGHAPYTEEGRRQFARVSQAIADFIPDVIWSSPLERSLELAKAAARLAEAPLNIDERLLELDFGEAENMTRAQIVDAGMRFNYHELHEPVAPGGESRADIAWRTADFCEELLAQEGRHAVVTHGGVVRAALVHLLGLAEQDIWAFHIHNAQLAYVRFGDGHGRLEEFVRG